MIQEKETRYSLARIESRIAWLTGELNRAEGVRDSLLRELQDSAGAHDKRPQAVR